MKTVNEHEIIKTPEGELAILLDVLSFEAGQDPVILVSKDEDVCYLRRSPNDIYEIPGIHPDILEATRTSEMMIVVEMLGDKVVHSYGATTGLLEDDLDSESAEEPKDIPQP